MVRRILNWFQYNPPILSERASVTKLQAADETRSYTEQGIVAAIERAKNGERVEAVAN